MPAIRVALLASLLTVPEAMLPQAVTSPARPIRMESARARVIVVDGVAAQSVRTARYAEELVRLCRRAARISEADSLAMVEAPVLDVVRDTAHADETISIFVTQLPRRRLDCLASDLQDGLAPARGLQFTRDTIRHLATEPRRIAILRNDALVPNQESSTGPGLRLTPWGLMPVPLGVFRVSIELSDIAPSTRGVPTDLSLGIWMGDAGAPFQEPLTAELVRLLWDRAMPTRLRRALETAPDPRVLALQIPAPADPALVAAHRSFIAGDHRDALERAVARLDREAESPLSRDNRMSARMQLGVLALAYGDTAVALVNFEQAVLAEPCLQLGPEAPHAAATLLNGLHRPAGACDDRPMHRVALRSLVRPGFGHPLAGRPRLVGALSIGVIGGAWIGAWTSDRKAHAHYAEYTRLSASGEGQPETAAAAAALYDAAESARVLGVRFAQAGVLLWGAAVVDGVMAERRRRARVASLSSYGSIDRQRDRARAVDPVVAPGRVGLRVAWF